MKSTHLLRVLSLLGFLLLMAPFYDQCNDKKMKSRKVAMLDEANATKVDKFKEQEPIELDSERKLVSSTIYDFIVDEDSQNMFELAEFGYVFLENNFAEFKDEVAQDFKKNNFDTLTFLLRTIAALLIIGFTIFQLIAAILKKQKWMSLFSLCNLIFLLIIAICIVFFDRMFETLSQIKWGFYTFIILQIVLLYFSKKELKKTSNLQ
jgi:hypothetical protein